MYSSIIEEHYQRPQRTGKLEDADGIGHAGTAGRGPHMNLYLQVVDGRVTDARYESFGCAPAIAAGSVMTGWLIGKTIAEVSTLTEPRLVEMLGGVPDHKRFCSALAIEALRLAVLDLAQRLCARGARISA